MKLTPDAAATSAPLATLHRCNEAANLVSERARASGIQRAFDLHHALYQTVLGLGLSDQPAVCSIGKTADAYESLKANLLAENCGKPAQDRRARNGQRGATCGDRYAGLMLIEKRLG